MTKYVSKTARQLLEIICSEHALQAERVAGGWIEPEQVIPCLIERLNARSMRDEDLRAFLAFEGYIPKDDDESQEREWAADPRPPNMHVARQSTSEPEPERIRDEAWINGSWDFPMPGERIA